MNLEQLTYFVESNRYHSFTKAAEVLYVSQSTISMAISALEKELGFELFHRSRKGLSLTVQGEHLIQNANRIMNELSEIKLYADTYKQNLSGEIKLAAAPLLAENILPYIIRRISELPTRLQLTFSTSNNQALIDNLYHRTIHFGIIAYRENSANVFHYMFHERNITETPLFRSEIYCYMNKNHALTNNVQIQLDDIRDYTLLINSISGKDIATYLRNMGINVIELDSYDIMYSLLDQQNGEQFIALIPNILDLSETSRHKNLAAVQQIFFPTQITYSILHNKDTHYNAKDFIANIIMEYLTELN